MMTKVLDILLEQFDFVKVGVNSIESYDDGVCISITHKLVELQYKNIDEYIVTFSNIDSPSYYDDMGGEPELQYWNEDDVYQYISDLRKCKG